jgi:hypothetical protein
MRAPFLTAAAAPLVKGSFEFCWPAGWQAVTAASSGAESGPSIKWVRDIAGAFPLEKSTTATMDSTIRN